MKTVTVPVILVFVVLLALSTGCAQSGDSTSFFVGGNTVVNRKTLCVAKASGGAKEFNAIGKMDLMATNHYWMFPVMMNGMDPLETTTGLSSTEGHLETNTITLKGAWVSYDIDGLQGPWYCQGEDVCETDLPDDVWVPATGVVEPMESLPTFLEAIPPTVGRMLDDDVAFDPVYSGGMLTVTITLVARMADGSDIESPEFQFPIIVCRNCLTGYDVAEWMCCARETTPSAVPCFPGQDEGYSCIVGCSLLAESGPRWIEKWALLERVISDLGDEIPAEFLKYAFTNYETIKSAGAQLPEGFDWTVPYDAYKADQQDYSDKHFEQ